MDGSNSNTSSLIVVALPPDGDPVRRYSSEKEPHLTLLHLGKPDASSEEINHVVNYVEHASSALSRFYMDVDHRGILGDEDADVLFFEKNTSRTLSDFRNHLLQDPVISKFYNSTKQFEEWTPHLTMGYPSSPAKKNSNGYPDFSVVRFDRIAVWTGDYSGPTFQLKNPDSEVLMSQISRGRSAVDGVISHHGVKGMHWGVRKSDSGNGTSRKTARADSKFEKKANSNKVSFAVYNGAANHMNQVEIPRINKKPQYKNVDFTKSSNRTLRDQYYKEYETAFNNALKKSANDLGTNASGSRQYTVTISKDGSWSVQTEDVKHDDTTVLKIVPSLDAMGRIVSISVQNPSITHYGVKGMHWGVRHDTPSSGGSSSGPRVSGRASEDSKTLDKHKAKIAAGGTRALNTKELQELVTRMNLEQQYSRLSSDPATANGEDSMKRLLSKLDTAQKLHKHLNSPLAKQIGKALSNSERLRRAAATAANVGGKAHRAYKHPATKIAIGAAGALL